MIPRWDGIYDKKLFQLNGKFDFRIITVVIRFLDFSIALLIILSLYLKFDSKLVLLGGIIAIFPDLIKALYLTGLKNKKAYLTYLRFHSKIQKDINWKAGVLIQIILLIIIVCLIFCL